MKLTSGDIQAQKHGDSHVERIWTMKWQLPCNLLFKFEGIGFLGGFLIKLRNPRPYPQKAACTSETQQERPACCQEPPRSCVALNRNLVKPAVGTYRGYTGTSRHVTHIKRKRNIANEADTGRMTLALQLKRNIRKLLGKAHCDICANSFLEAVLSRQRKVCAAFTLDCMKNRVHISSTT